MTFEDLNQLATAARQSRTISLDIIDFAPSAAENIRRFVDTTKLQLARVNVLQLAPDEIRLTGSMQLGLRIDCELRFFREGAGVGYTLTFATRNPLDLLRGEFRSLANLLAIEALWWTASSRPLEQVDISISGLEATAVRVRQGFDNLHLRVDSPVLDALRLAGTVFEVAMAGQVPKLSVAKELNFRLPPALEAKFQRLTVGANGFVELDGMVVLKLLGAQIPPIAALMGFDPTSVKIRVPVPSAPPLPSGFPFQAITLRNCFAEVRGALGNGNYGIAADGQYVLPGGSGHGGTYRFEYSGGNTSPVPDTIELSIDKLTLSDVLNLMTPIAVRLPSGINDLVTLQNGYAYYAVRDGARSASGVSLARGITARGSITVFGAPAYFAADAHEDGVQTRLLTNPLRLGDVLALRGTGVRPPAQYGGPRFANDAIGIEVDTGAATASASLIVDFLGTTIGRMAGAIEQGGITLKMRTSLPNIAELPLEIHAGAQGLSAKGGFEFRQPVDLPFRAGFSLQGLGRISGTFEVAGDSRQARVRAQATLTVLGFSVSTPVDIDPRRLKDIAELVLEKLYEEAKRKLLDAVELVRAFLEGAVRYTLAAAEAGRKLVTYLAQELRASAAEVIAILHGAGATANQALALVRDGAAALGQLAFETIVSALRTLYNAAEALETLRDWAVQFGGAAAEKIAENLAWLLRKGGFAVETIVAEAWRYVGRLEDSAKAFARVLMLGGVAAGDIARYLKLRDVGTDQAGRILGEIFGTDIIESILKPAFGAKEAARVAGNVQRELGRFGRNVEDEWNSFWGRLGVRW